MILKLSCALFFSLPQTPSLFITGEKAVEAVARPAQHNMDMVFRTQA